MSLAQHLRALGARFDAQALLPPVAAASAATPLQRHAKLQEQLQAWCWQGAGPGTAAWWQPGAQPAVGQRLAVAIALAAPCGPHVAPETSAASHAHLADWANAFARQLDGGTRLDNITSKLSGLQLRLATKLQDAQWWRPRQPSDPWDAGWAIHTPAALQQLQHRFLPRRATLILADAQAAQSLQPCLAALALRRGDFSHPVRWLWVGEVGDLSDGGLMPGPSLARFQLGAG